MRAVCVFEPSAGDATVISGVDGDRNRFAIHHRAVVRRHRAGNQGNQRRALAEHAGIGQLGEQRHLLPACSQAEIDQQAKKQLELIVQQMAEREDVTEELKASDQMEWVRRMNNIRNRAEEVIKTTLIYH